MGHLAGGSVLAPVRRRGRPARVGEPAAGQPRRGREQRPGEQRSQPVLAAALVLRSFCRQGSRSEPAPHRQPPAAGRARLHHARRPLRLEDPAGSGTLAHRTEPARLLASRIRCRRGASRVRAQRLREAGLEELILGTSLASLFPARWLGQLLLLLVLAGGVGAQAADLPAERGVKAAYLFKFLGYVDWPPAAFPDASTPFVIGIAGADDIADELLRITATRSVNNRALNIRRIRPGDTLNGVQLLYIAASEGERGTNLLRQVQRRPVLTVTDGEGGLMQGAVINFRTLDGRIRFDVSLAAAERNDLRLSSRLLSVAASVQGVPQ
ncbi:YfiR family protein [Oxalobacteraceae bacterium OM1]|nr:YfiR family protein [Oxalobacteraceae bacterium OM1]